MVGYNTRWISLLQPNLGTSSAKSASKKEEPQREPEPVAKPFDDNRIQELFDEYGIIACTVAVTKLTDAEIDKACERLERPRTSQANEPKNIDKTMTITAAKSCVLCSKQTKHLTSHYRNCHPEAEVYNARMSAQNADYLRHNAPKMPETRSKYGVYCYFCEKDVNCYQKSDIADHFGRHTGEYKKVCCTCSAIVTKDTPNSDCSHEKTRVVLLIPTSGFSRMSMYMCKLCNYAQCLEPNLKQHAANMHDIQADPEQSYQKVVVTHKVGAAAMNAARAAAANEDSRDSAVGGRQNASDTQSHCSATPSLEEVSSENDPSEQIIKVEQDCDGEYSFRVQAASGPKDNAATSALLRSLKACKVTMQKIDAKKAAEPVPMPVTKQEADDDDEDEDVVVDDEEPAPAKGADKPGPVKVEDDQWVNCSSDEDDARKASIVSTSLNRLCGKLKTGKVRMKKKKTAPLKVATPSVSPTEKPAPAEVAKEELVANESATIEKDEEKSLPGIDVTPPKSHAIVVEPDENRISNILYSNYLGQLKLKCLVGDCTYVIINSPNNLLNHLKLSHPNEKWEGVCQTCDKQILNGTYPLAKEYKHLEDVHLTVHKAPTCKPIAPDPKPVEPSQKPVEPEPKPMEQPPLLLLPASVELPAQSISLNLDRCTPAADAVPRPQTIKLRRLSGDMLSGASTLQNVTPKSPDFVISSVVSLSSIADQPPAHDVKPHKRRPVSSANKLKPWTKCPSTKSAKSILKLLRSVSLTALYKCMAVDCIFTTGDPDDMVQHLLNHEEFHTRQTSANSNYVSTDQSSWLECSYCEEVLGSCQLVVDHVNAEHGTCTFQCEFCFYRSASVALMRVHFRKYHPTAKLSAFSCSLQMKKLSSMVDDIEKVQNDISRIGCEAPG